MGYNLSQLGWLGNPLFLGKKSRFDILAAVKRTAIPHHATFLGWSLNGVDADSEKRLIA
ncbi:MAG: hypothetical protein GPJ22_02745 [Microcystis aeruginosa LL13-03]|nr:hypothetical protein [Microcystis aeruginosa SX13-11]NCR16302.1 hypothetical protein [Microcystis aeruginosa LL13-03]NCS18754.1 hypothetical protein [Microcystis aeruginosa G11-06]